MVLPDISKSTLAALGALLLLQTEAVLAEDWRPVIGAPALTDFISGKTLAWQEGEALNRGVYLADGTGTLYAWGVEFDRAWEVKGDDQLCFEGEPESQCFTLEVSATDSSLYRSTDVATGAVAEIREADDGGVGVLSGGTGGASSTKGGPAAASAAEMAEMLSNPANPIMIVFNNLDYVTFDGDLPGADDKTMTQYFFQTIVPFALENGNSILWRPGFSIVFDQDVPNGSGGYDNIGTDLSDVVYDLIYTGTSEKGTIWGYGAIGTIPTASDDHLGGDRWALGPEVVFGKTGSWGSAGFVLGHQWDFAGSGNRDVNLTTMNYFYTFTIKNGWTITTAPTVVYNHEAPSGEELTLPLGIGVAKTATVGGRPWQFKIEYWNNVVRPDAYAPEHTFRLAISPVFATPWNN